MADSNENNPIASGLKIGQKIAGSGELGCCLAALGCGGLIVIGLILLAFSMSNAHTRGLTGDAPPRVDANGGATGGTGQGQLDPNSTDPDCKTLLNKFNGTNITHLQVINAAARRWEVEAALVAAIARNESGFNARAQSNAGAQGMMQIMPETLTGLLDRNDQFAPRDGRGQLRTDPFDPEVSTYYGAKYLHNLQGYSYIGDNVTLIAAGYNAGPVAVEQYHGVPPYLETQNYARNVASDYQRYRNCLTTVGQPSPSASPNSSPSSNP